VDDPQFVEGWGEGRWNGGPGMKAGGFMNSVKGWGRTALPGMNTGGAQTSGHTAAVTTRGAPTRGVHARPHTGGAPIEGRPAADHTRGGGSTEWARRRPVRQARARQHEGGIRQGQHRGTDNCTPAEGMREARQGRTQRAPWFMHVPSTPAGKDRGKHPGAADRHTQKGGLTPSEKHHWEQERASSPDHQLHGEGGGYFTILHLQPHHRPQHAEG
jgi:hypothetical protein